MTNVIGISHSVHGSSAALLQGARFVAAAPQERFDRIKFSHSFPERALDFCLKAGDVRLDDVDAVAYFMSAANFVRVPNPPQAERLRFYPEAYYSLPNNILPRIADGYDEHVEQRFVGRGHRRSFYYIDHHTAHAAHAFYASPFEEAAILTLDARGDGVCGSLGVGRGGKIELLRRFPFPHSIGQLYSAFTEFVGFKPNSDEYKLMGLSAYGDPARYYDDVRRLVELRPDGTFELDLSYFSFFYASGTKFTEKFRRVFGEPRGRDEPFLGRAADIAAACQQVTQEVVLHLARALHGMTRLPSLCYAGGVALNSLANGLLLRETPFERIYIPADPSDTGASFGAAAYAACQILGAERPAPLLHDYHGPDFDEAEMTAFFRSNAIPARRVTDPAATAAELVADGKVVGWFQGRMEFGPRALGNRSILADPRRADMKEIVNTKIKYREPYRPFAPSVRAEKADAIFEHARSMCEPGVPTDFMIYVLPVRPEWRERIPAVTHADGTGRLQTVRRETNEVYWRLLDEFERRTGVPVILNTSFNVKDEPMVLSPADAVRCFNTTGLDHCVCGNYVLDKVPLGPGSSG